MKNYRKRAWLPNNPQRPEPLLSHVVVDGQWRRIVHADGVQRFYSPSGQRISAALYADNTFPVIGCTNEGTLA